MEAEWNLDPGASFADVPILQIYFVDIQDGEQQMSLRMLILAHWIARSGVPAMFSQTPASYMSVECKGPVVLVFDPAGELDRSIIPSWCVMAEQVWTPARMFNDDVCGHFVRALTTRSYYRLLAKGPMFFTSFLVFPASGGVMEPFAYQQVPVLIDGFVRIRTVVQGGFGCTVGARAKTLRGDVLLVPPFDHPVLVDDIDEEKKKAGVIALDGRTMTVFLSRKHVMFTEPSRFLKNIFTTNTSLNAKAQDVGRFCKFENLNPFVMTERDWEAFYERKTQGNVPTEDVAEVEGVSCVEDVRLGPEELLSEFVGSDQVARAEILECLGRDGILPSSEVPVISIRDDLYMWYGLSCGVTPIVMPRGTNQAVPTSTIAYEKLEVPRIVINIGGKRQDESADRVMDIWERDRVRPISGQKHCHYVAFVAAGVEKGTAQAFMKELRCMYAEYGFGELNAYPKGDAVQEVASDEIPSRICAFCEAERIEFLQKKVLVFAICDRPFTSDFQPHAVVMQIPTSGVIAGTEADTQSMVFSLYARIRQRPRMPDVEGNVARAFAGFRYQPVLVLSRRRDLTTIHLVWDNTTSMMSVTDDIGSVLEVFENMDSDSVSHFLAELRSYLGPRLDEITLAFLAETFSNEHVSLIEALSGESGNDDLSFFTIYPAPGVQVSFNERFQGDAVAFGDAERMFEMEGEFVHPTMSCYVLPRCHPGYKVALYQGHRATLYKYVANMSHLSWLSVHPGAPTRADGYPLHITALLKRNGTRVRHVNRFEFFPSS